MSVCVLTGDIVGSTDLANTQQIRIQDLLGRALCDLKEGANGSLDTYRGDGWQMDFETHETGLRHALFVRATLKSESDAFETRISIAQGAEEWVLSLKNDPVFVASGRALDDMPRDVLMVHASGSALHAATLFADHISRNWTPAQARAIKPFLLSKSRVTQKDVASAIGISRQAVGQALDAAGYHVIDRALRAIEEQAK